MADNFSEKLSNLSPEARQRVESVLKNEIEREVSAKAGQAAYFSRGILFSKSGATMHRGEEVILPEIAEMDEAKFSNFLNRIKSLKANKPE